MGGQSENRERPGHASGAMHADVPVWSDPCCSCEAEPYWEEAMAGERASPDAAAPTPAEPPSPGAVIAGEHRDLPGEGGMPRREDMHPADHRAAAPGNSR